MQDILNQSTAHVRTREDGSTYVHTHENQAHTHADGYHHVHSEHEKKAVANRLAKAAGHLDAVRRMVENGADCSEVLIQLAAVRSALNNTGKLILKNHISHCLVEAVEAGDTESLELLNEAIDKFIK